MPCNPAQKQNLGAPPGFDVLGFIETLRTTVGARDVTDVIVDGQGVERSTCQAICTSAAATLQHIRWPDGVADDSGNDYEPRMLDCASYAAFFRSSPRGLHCLDTVQTIGLKA